MEQFDIFWATTEWKNCADRRPCVILSPTWHVESLPRENVLVAPVSSSLDLYDPRRHLKIVPEGPAARITGFKKTSYVAVDYIMPMERGEFEERMGRLTGSMAAELRELVNSFLFSDIPLPED